MKVGDKYVLHSVAFPQQDRSPDLFVVVEIVEIKTDVMDAWTGEKNCTGLKAMDTRGREYFCCWDRFPSDSMTPMWRWTCKYGNKFEEWFDIVYVTHMGEFPVELPDCLKLDFLHYCKKHHEFTYIRNPGDTCWRCQHLTEEPELEEMPKGDVIHWGYWTKEKPKARV